MERSEGGMPLKNPGIDPGTVRLVAQRLKHYATPGPVTRQCLLECVAVNETTPVPNTVSAKTVAKGFRSTEDNFSFERVLVPGLCFPCRLKFQPTLQALIPSNMALYRILLTLSDTSVSLKSLADGGYRR
jgi:hypothetical protein